MSRDLVVGAQLGGVLAQLVNVCRFCGCTGDSCSTDEPGEKCELRGEFKTRCTGVACAWKYLNETRAEQREAERRAKRARRKAASGKRRVA